MNIDANDLIVGRIATVAAKKALLGEEVNIVNCKEAVFSGKKKTVLARFQRFREMGTPTTGPFIHRNPKDIVKRTVRGMLSYKQPRGRKAFERIKCYNDVPEKLKDKLETIEEAHVKKLPSRNYMKVKDISKVLGV